jgi:transposase
MKRPGLRIVEVGMDEIEKTLERVRSSLGERDHEVLRHLVDAYGYVTELVRQKDTSIAKLRRILFGAKTESSDNVLPETETSQGVSPDGPGAGGTTAGEETPASSGDVREGDGKEKPKRPGHGRNGAEDYRGAEKTKVSHDTLAHGCRCPEKGCKGKIYVLSKPGVIVRMRAALPIQARVWELEKLRCNLCGKVFTAKAPEGIGEKKYDETSAAMIALLRYGLGLPFNRIEKLEGNAGIPLAASTQWEIAAEASKEVEPVYERLSDRAADGKVIHSDDTPMTILELLEAKETEPKGETVEKTEPERTGVFTTGIVSKLEEGKIALYRTGRKHAGENLKDVVDRRDGALPAPIHMSDGLSRNVVPGFQAILANCLAHARRKFVEEIHNFPEECRHVIETLAEVYKNDAATKGMSPEERLELHKRKSGPLMDSLKVWLEEELLEKRVEPNSGLGKAITYMLNRWKKLTAFVTVPGAPLDNNLCERALKKAILHRKNSLFYMTENGARVGDIFMSLIQTAELAKEDPLHYLTELLRRPEEIRRAPDAWMPWNYRETLARIADQAPPRAPG